MKIFNKLIREVLHIEGGYSDHKSDSGGKTMLGITEAVARKAGYKGDMRNLTEAQARDIYYRQYWQPLGLDTIAGLSVSLAGEVLDTGVNMGVGRAGLFLQRALNALNRQGRDFPDLKVDGQIGPATLSALTAFLAHRGSQGEVVLLRALNALQGAFYIDLVERQPKNEDFAFGWFLNRVMI